MHRETIPQINLVFYLEGEVKHPKEIKIEILVKKVIKIIKV